MAALVTRLATPSELEQHFGGGWDIEHPTEFDSGRTGAVFLLTRQTDR